MNVFLKFKSPNCSDRSKKKSQNKEKKYYFYVHMDSNINPFDV